MMKTHAFRLLSLTGLLIFLISSAHAEKMRGDNEHSRKWNKFADDVLALHYKLTKGKKGIEKKTSIGGYATNKDFYNEEKFINKSNDQVISTVQWERKNPKVMHFVEVNVLDNKGRIIRDYSAAYLPEYHNAPTQTLINLHVYNGKLHAFRTYDAGGDRIGEQCSGKYKGKDFFLLLDEDELYAAIDGNSDAMEQAEYKACFKGLQEEVGKFIKPQ